MAASSSTASSARGSSSAMFMLDILEYSNMLVKVIRDRSTRGVSHAAQRRKGGPDRPHHRRRRADRGAVTYQPRCLGLLGRLCRRGRAYRHRRLQFLSNLCGPGAQHPAPRRCEALKMETHPIPFKPDLGLKPEVVPFFDPATNTISYIVKDPNSPACAVIDSVMDFASASGHISYAHADAIIAYIREHHWRHEWLLETHVHADQLSAAPYIQQQLGGRLGIGENITIVQDTFGKVFNEGTEFQRDGSL